MVTIFNSFWTGILCNAGEDYTILQIEQRSAHTSSAIRWPENIIHAASTASFPGA